MNIRSILAAIAMASVGTFAALPSTMLFQGNMTVDGAAKSGTSTLVVALYDAATSGTKVWEESFANVTLVNGGFAVLLGGSKALPAFDKPLFVQLAADGKAAATRAPLTLAPYAAMAGAIPNVRSSADTTFLDASSVSVGAAGQIAANDGNASTYRRASIDMATTASQATMDLAVRNVTPTSAATGSLHLTDSIVSLGVSRGTTGGGTGSWIELGRVNIGLYADTLSLVHEGSTLVTPALVLKPGQFVDGPNATIPTCDATTAGTIIYNSGYAGGATRFQGCVYLGAGVGTRYAWVTLNN